jgi:hypothetical protein
VGDRIKITAWYNFGFHFQNMIFFLIFNLISLGKGSNLKTLINTELQSGTTKICGKSYRSQQVHETISLEYAFDLKKNIKK